MLTYGIGLAFALFEFEHEVLEPSLDVANEWIADAAYFDTGFD